MTGPLPELPADGTPFHTAFDALLEFDRGGPGAPPEDPAALPLDALHTCRAVFQFRDVAGQPLRSADHVQALRAALKEQRGSMDEPMLDPIDVRWTAGRWVVIDGHHRLEAYRETAVSYPVAVRVLQVPLAEAVTGALKENKKARLSMTKVERLEAAWRMVNLPSRPTQEAIATVCGISLRTIKSMCGKQRELREGGDDPAALTWTDVKDRGRAPREWTDEEVERQADQWALALRKALGPTAAHSPDIVYRALQKWSPGCFERLAERFVADADPCDTADNDDF